MNEHVLTSDGYRSVWHSPEIMSWRSACNNTDISRNRILWEIIHKEILGLLYCFAPSFSFEKKVKTWESQHKSLQENLFPMEILTAVQKYHQKVLLKYLSTLFFINEPIWSHGWKHLKEKKNIFFQIFQNFYRCCVQNTPRKTRFLALLRCEEHMDLNPHQCIRKWLAAFQSAQLGGKGEGKKKGGWREGGGGKKSGTEERKNVFSQETRFSLNGFPWGKLTALSRSPIRSKFEPP